MQKAAAESAKTFPSCWTTKTESRAHLSGVPDRGTGSELLQSQASSSSTDSRSASDVFSPNGMTSVSDASPQSPTNSTAAAVPTPEVKAESSLYAAVNESSVDGNIASASTRKMNLNDYRLRRTKLSVTAVDHNSNSSVSLEWKGSRRSDKELTLPESKADTVSSTLKLSSGSKSAAKPRMKLKIGSEVIVKTFFSPVKQSSDVQVSDEANKFVGGGISLAQNYSEIGASACVNGDANSEEFSVLVNSSVESCGRASSNVSSCDEDSSDSEPPAKQPRMSFNGQFSSAGDVSACRWIHHD